MANVTKTEQNIRDVTGITPKAKEARPAFLKRLHAAAMELPNDDSDKGWDALSEDSQLWVNAASDAVTADPDDPSIEDFADALGAKPGDDPLDIPPALKRDTPEKEAAAKTARKKRDEQIAADEAKQPKASKSAAKPAAKAKSTKGAKGNVGTYKGPLTKKSDIIAEMLLAKKGATAKELMDAVGWTKITVIGQARQAGIQLSVEKEDGVSRYFGTKGGTPQKVTRSAKPAAKGAKAVKPAAKPAAKTAPKTAAKKPAPAKSKANSKNHVAA